MAETEKQSILLQSGENPPCPGTLYVRAYTPRERLIRALKVLGLYWGLAVLAIAIPLAHFVLVPAFLIAGPIMAYLRYRMAARSDRVTGRCPVNHNDIVISLGPKERPPLWKYCPVCKSPLHIVYQNQA